MMEKYLVAAMGNRDKTIAKMKASLYSLSIDELVRRSLDEYQGTVPNMDCSYCNEKTIVTRKKVKKCLEVVNDKEHVIDILHFPMNVCDVCGAEFDDMDVSVYLEELIRFEITKCLRTRQPIPTELDFNELIKM
ncbi:hypothetical protein ACA30_13435 [Virgibacillus soli]|nr:hypothetical protein ACA30_13435 [Virgibacillus soli]